MSNKPFDRSLINVRERPVSSDINLGFSESDQTMRELVSALWRPRASLLSDVAANPKTGQIGSALKVRAKSPASMSVSVDAGTGMVFDAALATDLGGIVSVNDQSTWKPIVLNTGVDMVLDVADGTNPRYDIIEARVNRVVGEPTSRDVLDTGTGVFVPTLVNKTLGYSLDGSVGKVTSPANSTAALSIKTGTPAGSPAIPATSPGYVRLSVIRVDALASAIGTDRINDTRPMLFPNNVLRVGVTWELILPGPTFTMVGLHTQPGVVVSSVDRGAYGGPGGRLIELYVFAGTPLAPILAPAISAFNASLNLPGIGSLVTVDATLQTDLAGISAAPAIPIAVGQQGWKIPFSITAFAPSTSYLSGIVEMNG